jgi:hypothetical protein
VTASSVASAKIEREQIEQLARTLRLELRVGESGAALFRRCLERAGELATLDTLDRLDRATGRTRVSALGGRGDEATAAKEGTPVERDAC